MGLAMDYNSYAPKYAHTRKAVEWVLKPLEQAISKLSGGSSVVEVGCGTGNYIIQLSKKHEEHEYTGFDLSQGMLEVAKSRSAKVKFVQGNGDESFPLPDNFADMCFLVDVIHHIVDYKVFFKELAQALKPGGEVLIVTDSEENFKRRSLHKFFPEVGEIERSRYPAIELLIKHAQDAGLKYNGAELAEGSMIIDDTVISNVGQKCSSSTRLMPDEAHKRGMERLKAAKGEKWISSYTVLYFVK
jgi:ubiquinone/menaquinone biosynthesis C-methylase UbiE